MYHAVLVYDIILQAEELVFRDAYYAPNLFFTGDLPRTLLGGFTTLP